MPNITTVGEAFATHNFSLSDIYLHDDVVWEMAGATTMSGKESVLAELHALTESLVGTTVTFRNCQSFESRHSVTVVSVADYIDQDGDSTAVTACDVLHFTDSLISHIASYTMALPAGA
jgi:ketosteroid isomerase-like protein